MRRTSSLAEVARAVLFRPDARTALIDYLWTRNHLILATLAVVIVILLLTYRSPTLWILPIMCAGVSLTVTRDYGESAAEKAAKAKERAVLRVMEDFGG